MMILGVAKIALKQRVWDCVQHRGHQDQATEHNQKDQHIHGSSHQPGPYPSTFTNCRSTYVHCD
jgi:hypothetical protein